MLPWRCVTLGYVEMLQNSFFFLAMKHSVIVLNKHIKMLLVTQVSNRIRPMETGYQFKLRNIN